MTGLRRHSILSRLHYCMRRWEAFLQTDKMQINRVMNIVYWHLTEDHTSYLSLAKYGSHRLTFS